MSDEYLRSLISLAKSLSWCSSKKVEKFILTRIKYDEIGPSVGGYF